jgi:phospholipase C
VALTAAGDRLVVASGYGFGSIAPVKAGATGRAYSDRVGVVSILEIPNDAKLAAYTRQVMLNNMMPGRALNESEMASRSSQTGHPIPMHRAAASPIQYVFYIIKENRSYDQVMGDIPKGNGDPSLVQFGRDVTPNQHALAERYVLLDNFYTVGDQSALGHEWCTAAYASDWAYKYGNGRNDSNPMKHPGTGFIWDNALQNGKTVRVYGEFGYSVVSPSNATWMDFYKSWKLGTGATYNVGGVRTSDNLKKVYATEFAAYDLRVPDQVRANQFLDDFRQFEQKGDLPNLVIIRMGNNHTNGTASGYPTPRAMVADNDLAVGRVIDAISRSRFWPNSAIFVTEDDAQNGLDHVDGHRTVTLVVSPYAKRNAVDSTMYTHISLVRTIEQLLGLPPMNQYDLAAEPMFNSLTADPDTQPYTALPNQIPLDEMNPAPASTSGLQRKHALASAKFSPTEADSVDEDLLNRIIWHSTRGYQTRYPKD